MIDALVGAFAGLGALGGLILASGAHDEGMYFFGLGLFAFGGFLIFVLMKQRFDAAEAERQPE
jgi:hypothetical protein